MTHGLILVDEQNCSDCWSTVVERCMAIFRKLAILNEVQTLAPKLRHNNKTIDWFNSYFVVHLSNMVHMTVNIRPYLAKENICEFTLLNPTKALSGKKTAI